MKISRFSSKTVLQLPRIGCTVKIVHENLVSKQNTWIIYWTGKEKKIQNFDGLLKSLKLLLNFSNRGRGAIHPFRCPPLLGCAARKWNVITMDHDSSSSLSQICSGTGTASPQRLNVLKRLVSAAVVLDDYNLPELIENFENWRQISIWRMYSF